MLRSSLFWSVTRLIFGIVLALLITCLIAAIVLACAALVASRSQERYGLDHAAQEGSAWLWIEGQPIHYLELEPEPEPEHEKTLVLVHGHSVEGMRIWQANAESLARSGMRVILVDLKGYGNSARDESGSYTLREQATLLATVLNELRALNATVVGHGWGSGVVLQMAYEQPQFVDRLVLTSPLLCSTTDAYLPPISRVPGLGRAYVWATSAGGPLGQARIKRAFFNAEAIPQAYLQEIREPARIVGTTDTLLAMARAPLDSDLPVVLAQIRAPTLILLGAEDGRRPHQDAREISAGLPDAQVVDVPGAGHYLQIERAGLVNRYITDFALRGARPGPS